MDKKQIEEKEYIDTSEFDQDFNFSNPYFLATKTASQSVGTSDTKITWNNIISDNFGWWDATNNRYVVKKAGVYQINVMGTIYQSGNSNVADVIMSLYKKGSKIFENSVSKTLGWGGTANFINISLQLNSGDYIEIYAKTTAGSPIFREILNYFNIVKIQ